MLPSGQKRISAASTDQSPPRRAQRRRRETYETAARLLSLRRPRHVTVVASSVKLDRNGCRRPPHPASTARRRYGSLRPRFLPPIGSPPIYASQEIRRYAY
jgi:hypothetical protein